MLKVGDRVFICQAAIRATRQEPHYCSPNLFSIGEIVEVTKGVFVRWNGENFLRYYRHQASLIKYN